MKYAKCLRTPILKNIWERLLLWHANNENDKKNNLIITFDKTTKQQIQQMNDAYECYITNITNSHLFENLRFLQTQ